MDKELLPEEPRGPASPKEHSPAMPPTPDRAKEEAAAAPLCGDNSRGLRIGSTTDDARERGLAGAGAAMMWARAAWEVLLEIPFTKFVRLYPPRRGDGGTPLPSCGAPILSVPRVVVVVVGAVVDVGVEAEMEEREDCAWTEVGVLDKGCPPLDEKAKEFASFSTCFDSNVLFPGCVFSPLRFVCGASLPFSSMPEIGPGRSGALGCEDRKWETSTVDVFAAVACSTSWFLLEEASCNGLAAVVADMLG